MPVVSRPCFVAGASASGDPQTNEVATTRGGSRTACVWSGSILTNAALTGAPGAVQSGNSILFYAGAGRLNTVFQHQAILTLSGVAVTFYDAGAVTASGTSVSGQRFLGILNSPGGVSGQLTLQAPFDFGTPFTSGLCASAPSGTPGFTLSYTIAT